MVFRGHIPADSGLLRPNKSAKSIKHRCVIQSTFSAITRDNYLLSRVMGECLNHSILADAPQQCRASHVGGANPCGIVRPGFPGFRWTVQFSRGDTCRQIKARHHFALRSHARFWPHAFFVKLPLDPLRVFQIHAVFLQISSVPIQP